jgi:hypothetical protein
VKKLALLLIISGCTKAPAPATNTLVGDTKKALAERERRLTSFRLVVDTTEGENRAHHEFSFRSPNKSRGRIQDFEIAFDGKQLVKLQHAEKKFEVVPLELPAQERAFALASTFMPFVPEGYRAPLLPMAGVEGKQLTDKTVELTVKPGDGVTVQYVLRVPSGDFLEKRTVSDGKTRVLKVEKEQCDEKLALCVPTKLVETLDGAVLGVTEITSAEINPELPQDVFAPKKPADWP